MDNLEKVFLDKKGYEELLSEIARLENELAETSQGRTEVKFMEYTSTSADVDNRRAIIVSQLKSLYHRRDNCEILQEEELKDDSVDRFLIGDIAEISLNLNGLSRRITVMLVTNNTTRIDGVSNITINSPMGRAIYGATVGTTGTYKLNGKTCGFEVHKIVKSRSEDNGLHQ